MRMQGGLGTIGLVLGTVAVVAAQGFGGGSLVGSDAGLFSEMKFWIMGIGAMLMIIGGAVIYFHQTLNMHGFMLSPVIALVALGGFLVAAPGLAARMFGVSF